ncbi:amino acid transporter [Companilactobacillus sp. RD055328]|uniref:APC family permease n=1 Tax=Companilactobacillus sp. RD055328 TaxID=2916634 RepID=UPI001FC7FA39|nr:amino acid permease [Companilactobacillus sp. RD055328]GKQ42434.1 amino acid transporter [Companilactobacillus sp. RD055328]
MPQEQFELGSEKKYISWPVIALMDFVTVIGFDDIIYNFQNQGLGTITTWILMLFLFVIPYEMMVGHLGSVFNKEGGGLSSWVRGTWGDTWGYVAAWTYWVVGLPYLVDVANSMIVSFGWLINGDPSMQDNMSNSLFALLTALIFTLFIFIQHRLRNSLQWLGILGGGAMFIMTILYVIMTFAYLGKGGTPHSQPFTFKSIIPKFNFQYFTTLGLFIFAMNGSEYIAPYVNKMKNGGRDFSKAMWMLAIMTGFLTVLGSFSLGIFFNAHDLPHDLKMNGSYYAFQYMGNEFGVGQLFMYIFSITQAIYMMAQLAVLIDAGTRMFFSDTAKKFLPEGLTKTDKRGLPINGYWLTTAICTIILILSATLPNMNSIFNQLLNLNGIVSPFATCFLFTSFITVRLRQTEFPSKFVFIKNRKLALVVGWWCLIFTFSFACLSVFQIDEPFGSTAYWHVIVLNIVEPLIMIAIGVLLPFIAKYERNHSATVNKRNLAVFYTLGATLITFTIIPLFRISKRNTINSAMISNIELAIEVLIVLGVAATGFVLGYRAFKQSKELA